MLNKTKIRRTLKSVGYTIIPKSWYINKSHNWVIFRAYESVCGNVSQFSVALDGHYATKQELCDCLVFEADHIEKWFR